MEKSDFLKEVEYACQEITNRYFSVEVAQGRFSDEPWWIKKIKLQKLKEGIPTENYLYKNIVQQINYLK